MNDLLIQAIGVVAYSLLAISYLKKTKRQILVFQIFSYISFIIHYYFLNGITAVICNVIGLVALVAIYFFDKYKLKNKLLISIFFISLIIVVNIIAFQNIFSIFPMIAMTIVILSFLFDNENVIRSIGILSIISWLIYAIAYKSYSAILFQGITLINVVISIVKNMKMEKNIDKVSK